MNSHGIGWIDFSSEHREKVRTAIDLLSEEGVVDELGIGVIRDSFADRMFPGISTIQTRAKYFTLTAWLIRDYEQNRTQRYKRKSLETYLETREKECRIRLVERYGTRWRNRGIIGGSFGTDTRRDVVRKPSSIYWNGLRTFGMVSPDISLGEFSRRLLGNSFSLKALMEETSRDRGDDLDAEERFHPRVIAPAVRADYWDQLEIELTHEEAEFLRHQITASQPHSLIGQILLDETAFKEVLKLNRRADFRIFSELPFIRRLKQPDLIRTVVQARDFSRIFYGAHIRYNILLQERFGVQEEREEFEEYWEAWREDISEFPADWETAYVWERVSEHGSQVPGYTRRFVEGWIEESRKGTPDLGRCDELVITQEKKNKSCRARLRPNNKEEVSKWIGLNTLDYRLTQALRILQDIDAGQRRANDA